MAEAESKLEQKNEQVVDEGEKQKQLDAQIEDYSKKAIFERKKLQEQLLPQLAIKQEVLKEFEVKSEEELLEKYPIIKEFLSEKYIGDLLLFLRALGGDGYITTLFSDKPKRDTDDPS